MVPGMPAMRPQPSSGGSSNSGPFMGPGGAPMQAQPGPGGGYGPSGSGSMVPMASMPMGSMPLGSMAIPMPPHGYMGMPLPGSSVAMMTSSGMMAPPGAVMMMPGWGPPAMAPAGHGTTGMPAYGGALAAAKAWKLFVGQISFDLTEEELYPFFAEYGTILELALPRTDGRSRGYAFLTYSNQAEAQAAIEGADGAVIPSDPRARALTVRWADSKAR